MISGDQGGIGASKARRAGRRWARPIAEVLEGRQLLATITVNSSGDADGADGSDTLSLRQAIEIHNGTLRFSSLTPAQQALVVGTNSGLDTIDFAIPGTGPFTIAPTTSLPETGSVNFDGYSQPGSHPNTNGPGLPDNAVIQIELSGAKLQIGSPPPYAYGSGLIIDFDATIQGLAIDGFNGLGPSPSPGAPPQVFGGGVALIGGNDNLQGDFIGVGVNGETPSGNAGAGVISYSAGVTIGGTAPADRNVISGNAINIKGANLVEGNFIGTDASGTRSLGLPAAPFGQGIINAGTIGGTVPAAGNVISGNRIGIQAAQFVEGNLIGTDLTGTKPLGNSDAGIYIGSPPVPDLPPVFGFRSGVFLTVGGTAAGAGNVISNNAIGIVVRNYQVVDQGMPVVEPSGLSEGAVIQGNRIGTDASGTLAMGNVVGIQVADFGTATIGGSVAGAGNLISGNTQDGVETDQSTFDDLIQGNLIGTNATGVQALGNGGVGVSLAGSFDTVGGTAAGAGNVISGNALDGLVISPQPSSLTQVFRPTPPTTIGDLIQGNFIGTSITRDPGLDNGGVGLLVAGSSNTIGGTIPGSGNTIAFNKGAGIAVINDLDSSATPPAIIAGTGLGNTISSNSIFDNGGLGIDLGLDGVTPNNPAGSASGPNHLQPYPVLTSATPNATGTVIAGTLDAAPSTRYVVQFYSSPTADPSGFGQGQVYLGSALATTDAGGHASISLYVPASMVGQSVTATATDPEGDTSEFSGDIAVSPLTPPPPPSPPATTTTLIGPASPSTAGQPVAFAAVVTSASGTIPTGFVLFGSAGVILGEVPLDAQGVALFYTRDLPVGVDVVAAAYLSDASNPASLSNYVLADVNPPAPTDTGPTVASARVTSSTSVKVTFSRPLLLGPAQDTANYAIVGPDGKAITIQSAAYRASDDSVTLTTRQALNPRLSYRLTVDGQRAGRVVDVAGIPLDGGGDGQPGSSYVGTIAPPNTSVAGVHPTGPKKSALALRKGR